ncbi:hypothetical protein FP2506_07591 [Fulvimarina pelagi HTCC2506]|uniref:LPS-assembly protein LptD n=2 Tax=Fulvimarina pelagi TaxID=217511 RepID=Q0G6M8_9HYPH|nr:hypothetical protein FP2506_07591 [Fulvimarina pelagi HTCC2506]
MGIGERSRKSVLLCGTALALSAGFTATGTQHASAQAVPALNAEVPADAQLFLEADTVTYDSERALVSASGGVQVDYGDYKVVARELIYDQRSKRLIARGDVELQQPDGNRIYADQLDLTDDFRDGFVQALRIETPDNTRFAAASATRADGSVTTFNRGVYTACEPCRENPDRAPLWQVKARKIVWDQQEKEIRYYGAQFEFFGAPIAYLPYFQSPDPTVKRKSGFLAPEFKSGDGRGYGLRVPYFYALSDDKDFTVAGTYYTKQGFLGEIEYRQAFQSGIISVQSAGISQQDRFEFDDNTPDYGSTDRGMIGTKGRFALSDKWTFGWDWLFQSDDNFANTYEIDGFSDTINVSEVYLTGLGDQSFFDLRVQEFDYQSINPDRDDQQPSVLPVFDYERIEQEGVLGGEVELDFNVVSLSRDKFDFTRICNTSLVLRDDFREVCVLPEDGFFFNPNFNRNNGLEGDYTRGTAELSWSDQYTLPSGLVLIPTTSVRGDLYTSNMESPGFSNRFFTGGRTTLLLDESGAVDIDEAGSRGMAMAALEARYPYLIQVGGVSHVIEPIAQVIARTDEEDIGLIPNEDAGTLVFNATNLFSFNKFSGYDRVEGGHRANVGVRYSADLGNSWMVNAIAGQSYHLGGRNSYDQVDLALAGFDSGLETDSSDYVGLVSLQTPFGFTIGTQGRYDEDDFELKRQDVFTEYSFGSLGSAAVSYTNIAAQPIYGSLDDRSQVSGSATLNFATNWTALAGASYDIENDAVVDQRFGIRYADECFSLLVSYRERTDRYSLETNETTLMFNIGLRTISDFEQTVDLGAQ